MWTISLHPWVSFVIMPLFALANAGVTFPSDLGSALADPVALGVIVGLVVGKPVGVLAASWMAVALGLARLPEQLTWRDLLGLACLGGIGFTMSLYIGALAYGATPALDTAKVGVLVGSPVSGFAGGFWLVRCYRRA